MVRIYFVLVKASSQVGDDLNNCRKIMTSQAVELQQLRAEFELLQSDLALRLELTSELTAEAQNWEKKFQRAEEEKLGALHQLNVALENQTGVADQVGKEGASNCNIHARVKTDPKDMCSFLVDPALRGEGSINSAAANI